jgi:type I restriction enzyme, S subunit
MFDEMPDNWEVAALGDLLTHTLGGDWGKAPDFVDPDFTEVFCIRASELRKWDDERGESAALRKVKQTSLIARRLADGDIIVEISGGGPDQPVGRTALIDISVLTKHPDIPKICTNFFRQMRPSKSINSRYLSAFLSYFYASGKITEYQAGSNNLRNLRFNDYLTISVPVPPFPEQCRIVAKIDELSSDLDKGILSLRVARQLLTVCRQAILKHAFEGKFTAQWREKNKGKLKSAEQLMLRIKKERDLHYAASLSAQSAAPNESAGKPRAPKTFPPLLEQDSDELPTLPTGWIWERLGWMTCGVEYGTAAKSSKSGSVPVVRMGNMQNAKFDWSDLVYTSDAKEIRKYALRDGDVLFNRTNSPELVGKTAIYRGERPALFAGYLIRINQVPTIVESQYLNLFLTSHLARRHGNRVKTDGVNQSNINGEKLSNYPFPYCSLPEQREIVKVLEEKLSIVDQMIADADLQLQIAKTLRQSILKKAFQGHLVDQDPNDEPARLLLERVRNDKTPKTKFVKTIKEKDAA